MQGTIVWYETVSDKTHMVLRGVDGIDEDLTLCGASLIGAHQVVRPDFAREDQAESVCKGCLRKANSEGLSF